MSILAFIGLPGSGKSYGVVQNVVVPNLKKRRTIVTNLPLIAEKLREDLFSPFEALPVHLLTDEQFQTEDLLKKYPGAVFIIDEAQRYFPAGMTEAKLPGHYKDFFSMHRHSACPETGFTSEIVLVSQCTSKIASPVRTLVEYTYIAKKMSSVGADNRYRVDVFEGCQSIKFKRGQFVRQIFGKYEAPFIHYYKSHTQSSDNVVANESRADARASVWKSGKVKAYLGAMIAAPILIVIAFYQVGSALNPEPVEEKAPVTSAPKPQQQPDNSPGLIAETTTSAINPNYNSAKKQAFTLPDMLKDSETDWIHFSLTELGARSVYRAVTMEPVKLDVSGLEPSPEWRLAGYISRPDVQPLIHAVNSSGSVRRIPRHDCIFYAQISDYVCVIGSYQVTTWSGQPSDFGSMATHQAPKTIHHTAP
ncbi:MAG: hypothetical protein IBX50_14500 [Marinospirillum sp.]|uniref:zonular occludens toxin domain-containing protein n=1 Tax=Marinospirillum sp. TaxID=2183934 RepID=UPI0019FDF0D1|nr:zonular occludens toxin domain-containing protein [Marinospirillum sp.]MBE0507899.1 hypothetical protein [Marinospirillum sp.]